MRKRNGLKLHIGCGDQLLDGFVNIDLVKPAQKLHDVRQGLPYQDSEVDHIYSEHFIEHLSREEAITFLEECYRVLKPGGVLRIATPDLDDLIRSYNDGSWKQMEWIHRFGYSWIPNRCVMLNVTMRDWEHRHLYNHEDLKMIGHLAGFILLRRCEVGKSECEELSQLENRKDSIILEFLKESDEHKESLPLVSIVIPAYSPLYFKECLLSALKQTYLRTEIIVCNDNPSSKIGAIVQELGCRGSVKYIENPENLGAVVNYTQCYEQAEGAYIKFLNDDDLLEADCVRKMVCLFEAYEDQVTLVTSKRRRIDAKDKVLEDDASTLPLVKEDAFINGRDLGNLMLRHLKNLMGEPTTIMFRKKDLAGLGPTLFTLNGKEISFNVDMVILLNLLNRGNAVYIAEPLSCFRIHKDQEQQKPHVIFGCIEAWPQIILNSQALGFLKDQNSFMQSLKTFIKDFKPWEENPLLTEGQRKRIKQINTDFSLELRKIAKPAFSFLKRKKHLPDLREELQLIERCEGWVAPLRYHYIKSPIIRTP